MTGVQTCALPIFLPESCQRFLGRDLAQGSFGLFCQLVDHCLHGCSLLLVFVLSKRGKAKAPRPLLRAKLQAKGTKRCNFTPRYHPVSARKHKQLSAALKRRNGARRPMLISPSGPFTQAAQERTSAHTHAEALSAGEASLFAVELRAYFLRRCVSRYSGLLVLITMSYLSTLLPHLQVRAAIFREIGVFACLLAPSMVVLTYSLQKERYTVWPGMRLLFNF